MTNQCYVEKGEISCFLVHLIERRGFLLFYKTCIRIVVRIYCSQFTSYQHISLTHCNKIYMVKYCYVWGIFEFRYVGNACLNCTKLLDQESVEISSLGQNNVFRKNLTNKTNK